MNLGSSDSIGYACALNQQNNILFITENGLMKRIKQSEITSFNRPAKGELISKKVKSNPQTIKFIQAVQVYDDIRLTHDSNQWIQAKDGPLMDKTQTFSQVLDAKSTFYCVRMIEEVKIVDFKEEVKKDLVIEPDLEEENEHHSDVEFIHFDL